MKSNPHSDSSVAVVGGGPAGLATAKHLREEGFRVVVFEQSSNVGGQWNWRSPASGVWESMRTNTSHVTTVFSDFPHRPGITMFPRNQDIHEYLQRYIDHFGLRDSIRLNTRVEKITRTADGQWSVTSGQPARTEIFTHVVIASGRYNKPFIPKVKGLDGFKGEVSHTFHYKNADHLRDKRVLVVGNSISALEICADLATDPSTTVISSCRKPRYIFTKIIGGKPTDCVTFHRFGSLLFRAIPPEQAAEGLKQFLLTTCGNPAQYGGLKPSENILEANITQCQDYLFYIAEGKIAPKVEAVEFTADSAVFADGSREKIDAVIFGTGFDLNLPFLGPAILRLLDVDDTHLDLYKHTFHPDLPGLAFVGLYSQQGPYIPVVELQARWVAMTFSGVRPLPSRDEMVTGIEAYRQWKQHFHEVIFHDMVLLFADAAGVAPDLAAKPELAKALLFGPLAPVQFRMTGHGQLPDADKRYAAAVATFGCITSPELDEQQCQGLELLANTLKDIPALATLAAQTRSC